MAERATLGRALRAARERVGLTQLQLAERVGLASNHIARLESGEKSVPRFDTVARLAAELGLSLDELSVACGYTDAVKASRKDRAALAQSANELAKVLDALEAADSSLGGVRKSLSTVVGSLQRAAGIPAEPPRRRR